MADKRMNLELYAKVKADVSDMELKVKSIKDQLSTLEMPRTAAKGFEKVFKDFETQLVTFKAEASKGVGSVEDIAKISRAWDKVVLSLSKAGIELEGLDAMSSNLFPKEVAQNIKTATDKLNEYEKKIEKIQKSPEYKKKEAERSHLIRTSPSESALAERQNAVQRAQARKEAADQAFGEKERQQIAYLQQERARLSKITKSNVTSPEIENLRKQIVTLQNKKILTKENKITARVGQAITGAEDLLKEAGLDFSDPKALLSQLKRKHGTYASAAQRTKTTAEKEGATQAQKDKAINADARLNNLENQITALETLINNTKDIEKGEKAASDLDKAINAKLSEAKQQKVQAEAEIAKLQSLGQEKIDASANYSKESKDLVEMQQAATLAKEAIARLDQEMATMTTDQAEAEWQALSEEIKKITGIDVSGFKGNVEKVNAALEQYKGENLAQIPDLVDKIKSTFQETEAPVEKTNEELRQTGETAKNIKKASDEAEHLKSSFMQFFSITNAIQLFKRAIKDAFNTVKQLDKAMTETAVVTDFSVGDMWKKLPEYTALANDLGTTTLGAYETMTLFYQQGLKTDEAFGVGTEAMKMARIAGLDYANATNLMTAALRGFNMEVDNNSAQRINDVYSELAAITAADTEEIARAMTKTASIAHNAGMEFETTSAFLTQIIETTRESAETAGTAMKTVIARFQEMRKSPAEIGEIDGEIVDANKIEAALRSVGVALRDGLTGQFRDLDDVFLELASKWDSLDTNTQRYIATIAAGSRQQSRFLAMMSDYGRTMELVTAANESAGASQKQFEKTLDSLESKLNKLKNAWDEFTMGLANSSFIKSGVDLLTELLSIVNGLTKGTGNISSFLLKLGVSIGALKIGKKGITGLFDLFKEAGSVPGRADATYKGIEKLAYVFDALAQKDFKKTHKSFQDLKNDLGLLKMGFLDFVKSSTGQMAILGASIAAVTVALVFMYNQIQKASKANQLKNLESRILALQEGAEEARNSIQEIGESQESLAGFEEELNSLIVGTQAWKEALIKVNDEVLELIEKYPLLGSYVQNVNGAMSIQDAGWEALIAQQEKIALVLQNSTITEQLKKDQVQKDFDFDQIMINSYAEGNSNNSVSRWLTKKGAQLQLDWMDWLASKGKIDQNEIDIVQEGYSGGLTSKKFYELAEKAYTEGHYATDSKTGEISFRPEDKAWIEESWKAVVSDDAYKEVVDNGVGLNNLNTFINSISNHADDFITSGKVGYESSIERNKMINDFVSNTVEASEAKEKTGVEDEALSNLLASTKYQNLDDQITNAAKAITSEGNTLKREYREATGKGFLSGDKLYLDKDFTQEMHISDDEMKRAIASANITQKIQESIEGPNGIAQVLSAKTDEQIDNINRLFSKDGSGLTSKDIAEFTNEEGKFSDADAKLFGFDNLEAMKDAFGIELEDLTDMIATNLKNAKERISKERQTLSKRMAKNAKKGEKDALGQAAKLAIMEDNFGEEFRGILNGIYDQVEKVGDQKLTTAVTDSFQDAALRDALKGTTKDTEALRDFISDIDFTDPLSAVDKLNQGLESSNAEVRAFSSNVLNSGSSLLTMQSRVQTFLKSADFTKIQEEIDEIIKKNGKLDASNILEMAEGCEELNQILEQTGATTEGLAELFNRLHDGEITINQITDAVLASLAGFESLDSMIAETLKTLEDFDPGIDENKFASFINDAYETLNGNLEKGAYGNTQNYKYLDFLLGPNWKEGVPLDLIDEQMKTLTAKLGENKENMLASWQDLAAGQNFYGGKIDTSVLGPLKIVETEEGIDFTGFNGMTTDEVVGRLAEAYKVSEDYAKMMLGDFKNYSTDLAVELNKNDYEAAIKAAYDTIAEKGFVDESELATIDKLYGQKVGTSMQRIKEMGGEKVDFTSFFDKDGLYKSIDEIVDELDRLSGKTSSWLDKHFDGTQGSFKLFNYDAAMSELDKFGFDATQKMEILQQSVANQLNDPEISEVKIKYETVAGETDLTITDPVEIPVKMEEADAEAEAKVTAEAIGRVFAGMEDLDLKINADGSITAISEQIQGLDDNPITIIVNGNLDPVETSISNMDYKRTIHVNVVEVPQAEHARGIKKSPTDHSALVGDGNGPELIQTKDGVYLAGQNGPEFAQIHKGDTVYTAEETRNILKKRSHKTLPRFAHGYGGATSGKGNSGGGSRGGSKDNGTEWKNTFDMLYNLLRQINEEQRERNRIERRYEQEVKKIGTSTSQLLKISIEELKQLDFEKQAQKALYERRGAELDAYIAKNSQFKEYGDVSTNEYGERVIRIDWEKIDAIEDQDLYKDVEEYIKQLEEWVDEMADVEDTINDIDDQIEEIKERGKDQYLDLEQRIKDALLKQKQDEIDELTEIDKTISEGNSKIVSAMEDSIAKQREDRENEKTEKNLQEKYRQKAYLEQDTSNANDLDILALQKEISEGEQDYTDILIDQKISELQKQNEEASQERQQQIAILTAQMGFYERTGQVWEDVHRILEDSLDDENSLIHGSALELLLQNSDSWLGLSELSKVDWLEKLENQVSEGMAFIELSKKNSDEMKETLKQIASTPKGSGGSTHYTPPSSSGGGGGGGGGSGYGGVPRQSTASVTYTYYYHSNGKIGSYQKTVSATGSTWEEARKKAQRQADGASSESRRQAQNAQQVYLRSHGRIEEANNAFKRYATGGLANFTGPAWLDGTKSKPEMVLNARDTENFIALRDVLESLRGSNPKQVVQNDGDNTYDIDINVETIRDDYDVESIANKVERLINQKARYRNNNTIGIMR